MSYILKNGCIYFNGYFINSDILIDNKGIISIADNIDIDVDEIIDISSCHVFSGFINLLTENYDNSFEGGYTNLFKQNNEYLIEDDKKIAIFNMNDNSLNHLNNKIKTSYVIYDNFNENTISDNVVYALDIDKYNVLDMLKYIQNNVIEILYSKKNLRYTFSLLYTSLVKEKLISLDKLIDLISYNIKDVFNLSIGNIENYTKCNICIYDLNKSFKYNGKYIFGKCLLTFKNGKIVYRDNSI